MTDRVETLVVGVAVATLGAMATALALAEAVNRWVRRSEKMNIREPFEYRSGLVGDIPSRGFKKQSRWKR